MSLAQLFYLKETFRENLRRWRFRHRTPVLSFVEEPVPSNVEGSCVTRHSVLRPECSVLRPQFSALNPQSSVLSIRSPRAPRPVVGDADRGAHSGGCSARGGGSDRAPRLAAEFGYRSERSGRCAHRRRIDPGGVRTDPVAIDTFLNNTNPQREQVSLLATAEPEAKLIHCVGWAMNWPRWQIC